MIAEELEKVLKEYDFEGDFDLSDLLGRAAEHVRKLEKDNKGLEEIISIQRHNLSLLRKVKCKN